MKLSTLSPTSSIFSSFCSSVLCPPCKGAVSPKNGRLFDGVYGLQTYYSQATSFGARIYNIYIHIDHAELADNHDQ